jgi:membrane associated rhomboid family serine protease
MVAHQRSCRDRNDHDRVRHRSPLPARFLITAHFTHYEMMHLIVNAIVLAVLLVAKIPEMHGVRLLGINDGRVE